MNHGRSIWLAALTALLVLGSACGDDEGDGSKDSGSSSGGGGEDAVSGSSGGSDKDASSGGGSGSDKDSGSGSDKDSGTGAGGAGDVVPVDVVTVDGGSIEVCGSVECAEPECCADPFASMCGLKINARACLQPQPMSTTMADERCPSVSVMNGAFTIPSCCTDDNKCGINAQAAGMGCISLEEVIAFTMSSMGAMGTSSIMWPEPQACE